MFRQAPRGDIPKGFDGGCYGKGVDFLLFFWFEDPEFTSRKEWEHYQAHLTRLPDGHPVGQDWASPYEDESYLDVVNGLHTTVQAPPFGGVHSSERAEGDDPFGGEVFKPLRVIPPDCAEVDLPQKCRKVSRMLVVTPSGSSCWGGDRNGGR